MDRFLSIEDWPVHQAILMKGTFPVVLPRPGRCDNHVVFSCSRSQYIEMTTQETDRVPGSREEQNPVERLFEGALWNSRLIVLLAVVFGTFSALVLFVSGSLEIINTLSHAISLSTLEVEHTEILIGIIGAVDFYLIGMVLLIFSFGIYELFISEIDIARRGEIFHSILEISNLDDLKNKIIKVIIMVLIVSFFQRVLALQMQTGTDMLFMALSIAALCIGVFFLQKLKF